MGFSFRVLTSIKNFVIGLISFDILLFPVIKLSTAVVPEPAKGSNIVFSFNGNHEKTALFSKFK